MCFGKSFNFTTKRKDSHQHDSPRVVPQTSPGVVSSDFPPVLLQPSPQPHSPGVVLSHLPQVALPGSELDHHPSRSFVLNDDDVSPPVEPQNLLTDLFRYVQSPTNTTNATTSLQIEVQMPWLDTFELGQGIDALTGASKGTAFQDVIWTSDGRPIDHKSTATSQIIHHLHELHHDIHFGVAATVNSSSPVALSTSFDYLRSKALSSSSFIVEYKNSGQYGFERPPRSKFELTHEAEQCLDDPKTFRQRYGDYFVYGFQRGYSFHTLVHYK